MPLIQQGGKVYQPAPVVLPRPDLVRPLETVKREAIESALILCGGNKREAARRLGISYSCIRQLAAYYRRKDTLHAISAD